MIVLKIFSKGEHNNAKKSY